MSFSAARALWPTKKPTGSQTPQQQVRLTASIPMGTCTDKSKLHSDIMAESNAEEASVNKPAETQAVKGDALASTTASVLASIEKITTSQSPATAGFF